MLKILILLIRWKIYNRIIAFTIFMKNYLISTYELYIVVIPRSGLIYFYNTISDISNNYKIKIINQSGNGRQHMKYSHSLFLNIRRRVFGNIQRFKRSDCINLFFCYESYKMRT